MSFPRSRKTYDEAALYEYAVGALGRQMRSVADLKRLLRRCLNQQQAGGEMIESVIAKLKEQHYLDDRRYAAAYSSYRRDNEKFGRQRVITDLKMKGVHGEVIDSAVGAAYEGVSEEKLARAFLARKRLNKPANQKETARIFRALMRAGFSSRVIFDILKHWDVDEEFLATLESE